MNIFEIIWYMSCLLYFWICSEMFKDWSPIFINLQSFLLTCKYFQYPSSFFMSTLKPTWCGERTNARSATRSFFPMAWSRVARNPGREPQRYIISTVPSSSKPYVSHHLTISHYRSSTELKYNFASHYGIQDTFGGLIPHCCHTVILRHTWARTDRTLVAHPTLVLVPLFQSQYCSMCNQDKNQLIIGVTHCHSIQDRSV